MHAHRDNSPLPFVVPQACRHSFRASGAMESRSIGCPRGRVLLNWRGRHPPECAARAFTLVEMVVVLAIILVLLGLLLPAASTLWNERRSAEVINTLKGILMTSRAQAMRTNAVEAGFLAFVDREGVQRLVPIERFDPIEAMESDEFAALNPGDIPAIRAAHQNVFRITDAPDQILPAPIRVVPRYVIEDEPTTETYKGFSDAELANNDFDWDTATVVFDQAQRHRNFFTMVFSTSGELLVWRDVLIQDADTNDPLDDGFGFGDRTGLPVGPGYPEEPTTATYYSTTTNTPQAIDPTGDGTEIPFLVHDNPDDDVAINFPSVDGLLVYDDSLFGGLPSAEKRNYLLRSAQPLYVSRWTGAVVRGPVGETP